MDVSLAIQVLSTIIQAYAAIIGIFSAFYLLFIQRVQVSVDENGALKGRSVDYFARKSVDKSFWIFFAYASSLMVSSLIFMMLLPIFYPYKLLIQIIVFVHILATIMGLVLLSFLIKKMIKLLPVKAP